jgi:hypothetical protein
MLPEVSNRIAAAKGVFSVVKVKTYCSAPSSNRWNSFGLSPETNFPLLSITVTLIAPIAMEEGLRFAIREGGRTVGAGVVTKVIE